MNEMQAIAADYAAHDLACIPALPSVKVVALEHLRPFFTEAPSARERDALFAEPGLNLAVVCGSVSDNLALIDAETERALDNQIKRCFKAGVDQTWIDRSPSGGGHIWYKLPCAVKSRGIIDNVEIKAQLTYCLAPPSVARSKVDGSERPYEFAQKTAKILSLESLEQLHWLNLQPAPSYLSEKLIPRKARKLLNGEGINNYATRSEAEQAVITTLVNAGFSFEAIYAIFRKYPAAGKFTQLERDNLTTARDYLLLSYKEARAWCANVSPARRNALDLLAYARSIPWRGRSGSSRRAVFLAHCALSYQSGGPSYHASIRALAEVAGIHRSTAATATNSLCSAGAVRLVQRDAFTFARRYALPNIHDLEKETDLRPLPTTPTMREWPNVGLFLPEAFRRRGLGLSAYEVLQGLSGGPLSCPQIAEKTGRNVKTVRDALKRLKKHGLVAKESKYWRGRAVEDIDFEKLARVVHMKGAAQAQRDQHKADRLRFEVRRKLKQAEQET